MLRFAYILHDDKEGWAREDVEEEQIMRHIDQLENVIARNRDVIYAFQAGYFRGGAFRLFTERLRE